MAESTGTSLRELAYKAAYSDRTSGMNDLADTVMETYEKYAEPMAKAAAQRRAARESKKEIDKQLEGFDPNKKNTTSEEVQDILQSGMYPSGAEINVDNDPSMNYQLNTPPMFSAPPSKMRSPIKNLAAGAFAAAYNPSGKSMNTQIDSIKKSIQAVSAQQKKVLVDKVVAELEDFVPENVDTQGFAGFKNGSVAVQNFGLDLKKKLAEKKSEAIKLNPYSQEYKKIIGEIDAITKSSKMLVMEKTRLSNLKKEWGKSSDKADNLYSKGSSKKTMNYLKCHIN